MKLMSAGEQEGEITFLFIRGSQVEITKQLQRPQQKNVIEFNPIFNAFNEILRSFTLRKVCIRRKFNCKASGKWSVCVHYFPNEHNDVC